MPVNFSSDRFLGVLYVCDAGIYSYVKSAYSIHVYICMQMYVHAHNVKIHSGYDSPDVLQRMVLYAILEQKLAHHDSTLGGMYMYTCIAAHVVCVRVCRVCHGVCVYVQICTPV